MKAYRGLLALVVCCALAGNAGAIDRRSYRIKGMGQYLAGIVEDRYTDLVANPARVVTAPRFVSAKVGTATTPLTLGLGYVAAGSWAAIGEWQGSRARSDSDATSLAILNGAPLLSNTVAATSVNNTDYPTAKLMKSLRLFGQDWGVGLDYRGSFTATNTRNESSLRNYNTTGVPVKIVNTLTDNQSTTGSSSFNLEAGRYIRDGRGETDLVFGIAPYYNDQTNKTYSSTFTDNDPDLNGQDINNAALPGTPNTVFTENSTLSKADPHINVQASVEYRARRRESDTKYHTTILGAYYWVSESRTRGTASTLTVNNVGGTITISNSNAYTTEQASKNESGEAYATYGRAISLMGTKLLFAYAAGLDLYLSRTVRTVSLAGIRATDTDSLTVTGTAYSSAGVEYLPVKQLALRAGISPEIYMSQRQDAVVNFSNVLNKTTYGESYSQSVQFSAGFGLQPVEPLRIDVYTTGDLFNVSTYNLQLQYVF